MYIYYTVIFVKNGVQNENENGRLIFYKVLLKRTIRMFHAVVLINFCLEVICFEAL